MLCFLGLFVLLCLIGINFKKYKTIDEDALSHDRTLMINGIFVMLILFSHFNYYVTYTSVVDTIFEIIVSVEIGQLMVTTFLFYSGYGILESVKNKKNYMDNFFRKRILKLFLSFSLAILLYLLLDLIVGYEYSVKTILLSFIGWESIGNSNWFIFATFCMYFSTLISFKIFKNDYLKGILLCFIFSVCYIFILRYFKYSYWYDTILCYNFGMLLSYYKDNIVKFLKNNLNYILCLILTFLTFVLCRFTEYSHLVFELKSICFVSIIFLITLKVKIGNKVLLWLGKNTFNIYILQRLSFIVYKEIGLLDYNIYLYFCISIITIFIIAFVFDKILKIIYKSLKLI